MNIDLLAFSGHMGLFGPQGTGGLYIKEGIEPVPLRFGGTGSNSESDLQPGFLPDRYESGTHNGPGIAGLGAGVEFVIKTGTGAIFKHCCALTGALLDGLKSLPRIHVHGHGTAADRTSLPSRLCRLGRLSTVSCTIDGCDNGIIAQRLNDDFDIAVRTGLHCAPAAHRAIGTFPQGTVRISFGYFNTEKEVETLLAALSVFGAS